MGAFGSKKKQAPVTFSISGPSGFQHAGHVGYNPDGSFDARNLPPELKEKAGGVFGEEDNAQEDSTPGSEPEVESNQLIDC
mmetsp:Transcript_470/g.550  ORF Transcript_470/g.550 Transcript_470/m.550 type:complete len:81 (+) Transcript_470:1907-2149(+)